jgi:hypothetical protein
MSRFSSPIASGTRNTTYFWDSLLCIKATVFFVLRSVVDRSPIAVNRTGRTIAHRDDSRYWGATGVYIQKRSFGALRQVLIPPKLPIAVGMPVARHPPHRSVREELPHTAPTLGTTAKALIGIRVKHFDGGNPVTDQGEHFVPVQALGLMTTPL